MKAFGTEQPDVSGNSSRAVHLGQFILGITSLETHVMAVTRKSFETNAVFDFAWELQNDDTLLIYRIGAR